MKTTAATTTITTTTTTTAARMVVDSPPDEALVVLVVLVEIGVVCVVDGWLVVEEEAEVGLEDVEEDVVWDVTGVS